MNTFLTSDIHAFHKNVIFYDQRPFSSIEEMNQAIIDNHNSVVRPTDNFYFLGDLAHGRDATPEKVEDFLRQLNGNKFFIKGNHDKRDTVALYKKYGTYLGHMAEIYVGDQMITLNHYAMRVWNKSHHGSWHLYGHCFSDDTELLTNDGWKTVNQLSKNDLIINLNLDTGFLENDKINEIYFYEKNEHECFNVLSKNTDLILTSGHGMIDRSDGKYTKYNLSDFNSEKIRNIPICGQINRDDLAISDDMLKLHVWIATDGCIENKTAVRFHLKKERKIIRIKNLLDKLNIKYSCKLQKTGNTKIYFNTKQLNMNFQLKPLPPEFINLSKRQTDILFDEYINTDGNKTGNAINAFQIGTSKKCECDLLQQLFITNNYSCNIHLTKRKTYCLSINIKNNVVHCISENTKLKSDYNGPVWCVNTNNGTVIVRRNGKVTITQNSHGSLPDDPNSLSFDVGINVHNYFPLEFEEVKEIMSKKTFRPIDHHR